MTARVAVAFLWGVSPAELRNVTVGEYREMVRFLDANRQTRG